MLGMKSFLVKLILAILLLNFRKKKNKKYHVENKYCSVLSVTRCYILKKILLNCTILLSFFFDLYSLGFVSFVLVSTVITTTLAN